MAFGKWAPSFPVSLGIFFCIVSSFAEKAPYPSFTKDVAFTKDATSAAHAEYYDYIVIGGGTAGCALAATLSACSKVLLLERGSQPYGNPNITHMEGFPRTLADTSPNSAAQSFTSTEGVVNHRARVLGGGTSINAGFYSRASKKYVQEVGWDPLLVNQSYKWVERKVVFRPKLIEWQGAVRAGLLEAGVLPDRGFTYEHLHGTKTGGSIFDKNRYRHTAADLLEYANQTMITVYLHATVYKILFKTLPGRKPKAYGVVFRDSKLVKHTALLNSKGTNEIILSAGTLGSPQLLMMSGIGPTHQLRAHGIKIILAQPMVGQDVSDNPLNGVQVPSRKHIGISVVQVVGINNVGTYIETNSATLQLPSADKLGPEFRELANQTIEAGLIAGKVAVPYSTGFLELQSKDPNENPRVTFNYFKDRRDLRKCVRGMKIIKKVVESRALSSFQYPSISFQSLMDLMMEISNNRRNKTLSAGTAYSMEQFCKHTVMTIWHYHGGCQVGKVVDGDYKVIGVDSLRVIDSSTFHRSPGTNPQATVMMLGRYMGQKILQQRRET